MCNIIFYIILGALTFFMCKSIGYDYKEKNSSEYKWFISKPKYVQILIRLCCFIFWPLVWVGIFLAIFILFILDLIIGIIE